MPLKRFKISAGCLGLALILLLSGCGLFWGKKDDFKTRLKLRVAVMPFDDSAGLGGPDAGPRIAELLSKHLSDTKRLVVFPRKRMDSYLKTNRVPMPLTQNTAAMIGRTLGLNAVILGSTAELSQIQKRTGWRRWIPFLTSKKDFVAAVLVARVVDVESGTILTADTGQGDARTGQIMDELSMGNPSGGIDPATVKASMNRAVESLAENIIQALKKSVWKGFVLHVSGDQAVLSGGTDVGIRAGDRFSVFAAGEKVTNVAGQVYMIPGPVKAQLEAVEVMDETTKVRVVSGQVLHGDTAQMTK